MNDEQKPGMTPVVVVWVGQVVSIFGSRMTAFALAIWAWRLTGQATALALVSFFSFVPVILLSPVVGALVDRWNRKRIMIYSDALAGASTLAILLLLTTGRLQIWHLYVTGFLNGLGYTFQSSAYWASIPMLVDKEQFSRVSGMETLARSAAGILAPAMAATFLGLIGIKSIMLIDLLTFIVAVGTLMAVRIPQPTRSEAATRGNLWQDSLYGYKYLRQRPGLVGLMYIGFVANISMGILVGLIVPMILARTGDNEMILASVQSSGAIGGLAGSLLMIFWSGPRRKLPGIIGFLTLVFLLGVIPVALGRNAIVWSGGNFLQAFFLTASIALNRALWLVKVAPEDQGRVSAARSTITQPTFPPASLLAGVMADRVFEPAMRFDGILVDMFGPLLGTGPGAGMRLFILLAGLMGAGAMLSCYLIPAIRNVESEPAHGKKTEQAAVSV